MANRKFSTPQPWHWQDGRFLAALAVPALAVWGIWDNPAHMACFAAMTWLLAAGVDALWTQGHRASMPRTNASYFRRLLRLYVPLQLAAQFSALWLAWDAPWLTVLSLAVGVGVLAGTLGACFAHELGHSPSRRDKVLAWALLTSMAYPHFMVEHYRGHHPRAATWDDPASAREGESLWHFLPRTLTGNFVHAVSLERQRIAQRRIDWWHSRLAWCWASMALFLLVVSMFGATKLIAFWLIQSVVAVLLLETLNYIEHYGLNRDHTSGKRQPFLAEHAWNASGIASDSLLISRQHHSDHHLHPWKPYPDLEAVRAPQLPAGYAGCLVLAWVSPLWLPMMQSRLDELHRRSRGYQSTSPSTHSSR